VRGSAAFRLSPTPGGVLAPPKAVNPLWTPANITTALWLDAADASTITESGGAVSQWDDKSGNSNNATTYGDPLLNLSGSSTSKPAIELDGTGDYLISVVAGLASFASLDLYIVFQSTIAAAADTGSCIVWGFGDLTLPPAENNISLISSTGSFSGETIGYAFSNTTRLGSSTYTRAANALQILNSKHSSGGTQLIVDGSSVALNLASGGITTSTDTSPLATGFNANNNLMLGAVAISNTIFPTPAIKISEVIALNQIASTTNRQRIEGYLAHKWGLTANLPKYHPFRFRSPRN
jgi:hypothetical protein